MDGGMLLIPLMGIIWPMLTLIIFLYLHYSSRNKVRMALIESGRDASIFRSKTKVDRLRTLKNGVICLMIGTGLFIGYLMHVLARLPEEIAYPAAVFICIGAGLVMFYWFLMKQPEQAEVADMV